MTRRQQRGDVERLVDGFEEWLRHRRATRCADAAHGYVAAQGTDAGSGALVHGFERDTAISVLTHHCEAMDSIGRK